MFQLADVVSPCVRMTRVGFLNELFHLAFPSGNSDRLEKGDGGDDPSKVAKKKKEALPPAPLQKPKHIRFAEQDLIWFVEPRREMNPQVRAALYCSPEDMQRFLSDRDRALQKLAQSKNNQLSPRKRRKASSRLACRGRGLEKQNSVQLEISRSIKTAVTTNVLRLQQQQRERRRQQQELSLKNKNCCRVVLVAARGGGRHHDQLAHDDGDDDHNDVGNEERDTQEIRQASEMYSRWSRQEAEWLGQKDEEYVISMVKAELRKPSQLKSLPQLPKPTRGNTEEREKLDTCSNSCRGSFHRMEGSFFCAA